MNSVETGKLIAKLRKEAGYTQKSLAEALYISDKAVSKWERGICMPDSALLTKLSMLLDTDIEHIISGDKPYGEIKCCGEIRCDDLNHDVGGKPLIHYLLSYFMLVGITDISVITNDAEYIKSLDLSRYGVEISLNRSYYNQKTIVVYDKILLFGANITRYFHTFLASGDYIIPVVDGRELPIIFTDKPQLDIEWHKKKSIRKPLVRGITFMPLNTSEQIADASEYIRIYEKYHEKKIADLNELAKNRGLIN